jgi:hypothetical protein
MRKLAIAVMTVLAAFASVLLSTGPVAADSAPTVNSASAATAMELALSGGIYGGSGFSYAMAQTWNGRAWTVTVLPQLPRSHVDGDSVSCGAPRRCVTSMASNPMPASKQVFVDVLTGTTWHVRAMSPPKDVEFAGLSAVSCASATSCVITGEYYLQRSVGAAFATWNGKALAPMKGSAFPAFFESLSCPATTRCAAAGTLFGGLTDWGYVGIRRGSAWVAARVAQPSAIVLTDLTGVSCASPTRCLAVGYLRDRQPVNGAYPDHATAVSYNGKTWTRVSVPFPTGSQGTGLESVSCLSATRCVAVGFVAPGSHVFSNHSAFTGFWNEKSWRTVPAA